MSNGNLIKVEQLLIRYEIEDSFIRSIQEYGLIEFVWREESHYITEEKLKDLERIIHLHYELNINFEGIDAINHLLRRNEELHEELLRLRNALKRYEEGPS